MKRRLFTILSALSLVLCFGFAGMLVRGRFVYDIITWGRAGGSYVVVRSQGERFSVTVASHWAAQQPVRWVRVPYGQIDAATDFTSPTRIRVDRWLDLVVFRATAWLGPPHDTASLRPIVAMTIGWDSLSLLCGIAPLVWVATLCHRKLTLRRRAVGGLCLSCGYDLRASKERCPECGTPISRPRDTATNAD